jgi:hypothetical protein
LFNGRDGKYAVNNPSVVQHVHVVQPLGSLHGGAHVMVWDKDLNGETTWGKGKQKFTAGEFAN